MDIEITTYSQTDYSEVIKLWLRAGLSLSYSDTESELNRFAKFCKESFFIMRYHEVIIGSVIGSFDGRRGYINHLAIDPRYQHQGLGSRLMTHLENWYREHNVVKIHLMIERENAEVGDFYEKEGWYYRDDLILMSKTLKDEPFSILDIKSDGSYISKQDWK